MMPGRLGMRRGGGGRLMDRAPAIPTETGTALGTRYRMRERLLAYGDDFFIENESGQRAFWVDGKALRVRETLLFKDMQGNELYRIQEKLARIRETMTIYRDRDVAAVVRKALITPLRDRYTISVSGSSDLFTQGNILHHEYRIERDGMPVANVSKRWFRIRDTYGVDITPGQDDLLILAVTVCIDAMASAG